MSDKDSNIAGGSNECSIKTRINALIKEFFDESIADKKYKQHLISWRSQDTKLSVSNWSKEKTYDSLQRKIKFLKQTILKYTETNQNQKQELGNLHMQRSQEEQKNWEGIQFMIATYDKNLSNGQVEYVSLTLRFCRVATVWEITYEILGYDEEYTLLCKKILHLENKLSNLKIQYNMNWMEIDSDLRNLRTVVNGIRSKNTSLLSATRSAEDTLQELKNKLRQTETVLCERKRMRENNFFRNIS